VSRTISIATDGEGVCRFDVSSSARDSSGWSVGRAFSVLLSRCHWYTNIYNKL